MSSRPSLLFARDSTSAALLDMPTADFLRLVDQGALPPPVSIGGRLRWSVRDLEAIGLGEAARRNPDEDIE